MGAVNGNKEIVKYLLDEGFPLNYHSWKNYTILHAAAWYNHYDVAEIIIDHDEDGYLINDKTNDYNDSPLQVAIEFEGDLKMLKLLLENGAEIEDEEDLASLINGENKRKGRHCAIPQIT